MHNKLTSIDIKEILKKYPANKENIIKALHELQDSNFQKFISNEIMDECVKYFNVSRAHIYGIVTYYSMFSTKPRGDFHISLCKSPVCTNMGSEDIYEYLNQKLNLTTDHISQDGLFSVNRVECLGRCGKAPSMMINKEIYTELSHEKIEDILSKLRKETNNDK
jgi:NADH:ubiquinone oxidoreductase subunit E